MWDLMEGAYTRKLPLLWANPPTHFAREFVFQRSVGTNVAATRAFNERNNGVKDQIWFTGGQAQARNGLKNQNLISWYVISALGVLILLYL